MCRRSICVKVNCCSCRIHRPIRRKCWQLVLRWTKSVGIRNCTKCQQQFLTASVNDSLNRINNSIGPQFIFRLPQPWYSKRSHRWLHQPYAHFAVAIRSIWRHVVRWKIFHRKCASMRTWHSPGVSMPCWCIHDTRPIVERDGICRHQITAHTKHIRWEWRLPLALRF